MIAECICAARFISDKETKHLMNVLWRTMHPEVAEKIEAKCSQIQREKNSNPYFLTNFERINNVLSPGRLNNYYADVLVFDYLTYSIEHIGKPLAKQSKEYCEVHPQKIINHNGYYYLVAYDAKKRKMRFFRIDRIMKLRRWDDEKHSGVRLAAKMDFPSLASRTFDMCFGESTRVTIQCANDIFDTVYERFGIDDDVSYRECDDKCFEVSVILDVSPKFFGWLCGFGKDAKLVSPPSVVKEFENYIDEIKSQY